MEPQMTEAFMHDEIERLRTRLAACEAERDLLLAENTARRTTLGDLAHVHQQQAKQLKEAQARVTEVEQAQEGLMKIQAHIRTVNELKKTIADLQAQLTQAREREGRLRDVLEEVLDAWVNGRQVHDGIPLELLEKAQQAGS